MIDKVFLNSAVEIRKRYNTIMSDLSEYEKEIKKLSNFLFEKADVFKNLQENEIKNGTTEQEFKIVVDRILAEIQHIEDEEIKITKKIDSLNINMDVLRKEEENLYQVIKRRYPKLTDDQIKSEIAYAIKDA
jgi:chromosome segregation ATPase